MLLPAFAPTITALPKLRQPMRHAQTIRDVAPVVPVRDLQPSQNCDFAAGLPKTSIAVTRIGWAGTLMVWSRFFVVPDFDDPFWREE